MIDYENEIWIPAIRFEKYYMVSTFGRIKRLPRLSRNSRDMETFKKYEEKIMSLNISNPKKYISAKLTTNGIVTSVQVHRLVLESFTGEMSNTNPKKCVNHKDGNKHNNKLNNLEWVTYKENSAHAEKTGLLKPAQGEDAGNATLNYIQVKEIKRLLNYKKLLQREIAEKFKTTLKIICDINTGRTWRHVQ